ncbi:MAG: hypothetical protein IJV32_08190 [Bacteroidales bacterium]|nr:hypothetical protein [Bacteroidales bacterium]
MNLILSAIAALIMNDGHTLTSLWDKYQEAKNADKPQTEAKILQEIKAKAQEQHLSVDFYDAATLYVETVSRRNWKEREPAKKALEQEVKAFGDPMVTFVWMDQYNGAGADALYRHIKANPVEGRTEPFFRGVGSFLGGALPHFITDNSEYVLWRITSRGHRDAENELREKIGSKYPLNAALDYYKVPGEKNARIKALKELAEKYKGTAAGLFPEGDLLQNELNELRDSKPASDAGYKDIYARAKAFEKRRKAFSGDEKLIAERVHTVEYLINGMESKGLDAEFNENNIVIVFQNLDKATVTLTQDGSKKPYKTWNITNKAASFYKADTVKIALPALSDGGYSVEAKNGKHIAAAFYQQYTLSIATRRDARGTCVYVADYKTGEPLRRATIRLVKGSDTVASTSMALDGFTPLPSSLSKKINTKSSYHLVAESGKRKSRSVWIDTGEFYESGESDDFNIYRDRGAYNPGDVLKYKAVLYSGNRMRKLSVSEGRKLTVILNDSEGNEIARQSVKTNEFGSASGEFTIPTGLRNGWFSMEIKEGKKFIGHDSFRVDEFVLPTFEISIEDNKKLYFVGDKVPVKGSVKSFSGHNVAGARAEITVRSDKETWEESKVIGADNTFEFMVPATCTGWYDVTVKVIDPTGETIEKRSSFSISEELSIHIAVENEAEGEFTLKDEPVYGWRWRGPRIQRAIVTENVLRLRLDVRDDSGSEVPLDVNYVIEGIGKGTAKSGETFEISLDGIPAGLYTIKADAHAGDKAKGSAETRLLVLRPTDKAVPEGVNRVFLPGKETVSGPVEARFGYGPRTACAVVTLFGENGTVLYSKKLQAKGMADLKIDYKTAYPDAVRLQIFWFADGESFNYGKQFRREKTKFSLPLTFSRFTDKAYPGTEYTFSLKTIPGVEALAAVWDKSIDAIARNWWPQVSMADYSVDYVSIQESCGVVSGGGPDYVIEEAMPLATPMMKSARMGGAVAMNAMMDDAVEYESANMDDARASSAGAPADPVAIRSEFENALTFQPHLLSDAAGNLSFTFRTSDKLSTYYVRVYAHTKEMQNAIAEDFMVVSLPVKVSILEPRFLYTGDKWNAAVTVSSIADIPVSGTVRLQISPRASLGRNDNSVIPSAPSVIPSEVEESHVTVPAGETMTVSFPVNATAEGPLTVTASFIADEFSDAVRVTVPVLKARQSLSEAHSAVLLSGMSREALLKELRGRFVNVPGESASLKEITVLDMVKDAIPSHAEPAGKDVLSLTEAWYVQNIAAKLSVIPSAPSVIPSAPSVIPSEVEESLLKDILACRNSDGGFAWFEGMNSSAVITAVVLERFALLKARGVDVPDVTSSVKFLDANQFGTVRPLWCGWLSDAQYMHVRAMYAGVPFEVKPVSASDKKRMTEFKKYAKGYLTPSGKRGLEGRIIAKARRLTTLRNLAASSEGKALAKAWGITWSAKLTSSIKADVTSLLEYAVRHRDGGWYYPNAVMPWRGLLESEAYAHAMLAGLLNDYSSDIADGIRLWLMLQKETQKWDTDPAFVDAIDAILHGSEAVLDTRVLALSASYEAPLESIKASGNGFTLERRFFRDGAEIKPGDPVYVGDKISAQYIIWNAENRSYVKLTAPREAGLQPVQQLSGRGWLSVLTGNNRLYGLYGFYNWNIYRNVKAECTEYYWEACPEENTTLTEEFYVVRSGRFTAPVPVIESLYAPHYRANAASPGVLDAR